MAKKQKHVSHIRLKFYHADSLYKALLDEPVENLKRLWFENYERHLNLVESKENWGTPMIATELVQSRHYIMAITAILKHWFEWDEAACKPKSGGLY